MIRTRRMEMRPGSMCKIALSAVLAMSGIASVASAAVVTWDAGASDENWSSNGNWTSSAGVVNNDSVVFNSTGTGVTTLMDEASPFVINSLTLNNTAAHTIDLQGNQLTIDATTASPGLFLGVNGGNVASLTVSNGTFAVNNGNLDVGIKTNTASSNYSGSLTGTSSLAFTSSNLTRMHVGAKSHQSGDTVGTINFDAVSAGVLQVGGGTDAIIIGGRLAGSSGSSVVTGTVTLGSNWTSTNFGSEASRADVYIGVRRGNGSATGSFTQKGGSFTAYANAMGIGYTSNTDTATTTGTLNLTGVTSLLIDTNTLSIGTTKGTGTVTLPGGTVRVNTTAAIGTGVSGSLSLDKTVFNVGTSLTLGAVGKINATIGATSAGIVLQNATASALSIASTTTSGRGLQITFAEGLDASAYQAGSAADHDSILYGLKWEGADRTAELNTLLSANKLAWNDDALEAAFGANPVSIFYDATSNSTYVGAYVTAVPEPATMLLLGSGAALLAVRRRRR